MQYSEKRKNKRTNNEKHFMFMFFVLILMTCFQRFSIFTVGTASLKPFHLFALVFLFEIYRRYNWCVPNTVINLFYLFLLFNVLLNAGKWGVNGLVLNYIFGFYLMTIIITFGRDLNMDDWLRIFRMVAFVMIVAVYINSVINRDKIIYFFNNPWGGHPAMNTFWGGGVNLEATWLAMLAFSFYKNRFRWVYLLLSFGISAVYASRVGIILNLLCVLWMIIPMLNRNGIIRLIAIMILMLVVVRILYKQGLLDYVLDRFQETGDDRGSQGRLNMWQYVWPTIVDTPWGCGLGNHMKALAKTAGKSFRDGNLHNLNMQNIIDLGWLGGLWYIGIVIGFIIVEMKNVFKNPFVAMLMVYCVVSMLQFRGGEPLTFCILGVYMSLNRQNNIIKQ